MRFLHGESVGERIGVEPQPALRRGLNASLALPRWWSGSKLCCSHLLISKTAPDRRRLAAQTPKGNAACMQSSPYTAPRRPSRTVAAMTDAHAHSTAVLDSQPHAIVERDGVRYTLLGTAHVSQASVDAVRDGDRQRRLRRGRGRTRPAAPAGADRSRCAGTLDLVQVIRTGKTALFAANLALAAYQRRLAEQLGIEPGAELKRAVLEARQRELAGAPDRPRRRPDLQARLATGWAGGRAPSSAAA